MSIINIILKVNGTMSSSTTNSSCSPLAGKLLPIWYAIPAQIHIDDDSNVEPCIISNELCTTAIVTITKKLAGKAVKPYTLPDLNMKMKLGCM
jgi:hypothetical protein